MKRALQNTFKKGYIVFRDHLIKIDITILEDLFKISEAALYDAETILRISNETGISKKRVAALIPVVSDIAKGNQPAITNETDLEYFLTIKRL